MKKLLFYRRHKVLDKNLVIEFYFILENTYSKIVVKSLSGNVIGCTSFLLHFKHLSISLFINKLELANIYFNLCINKLIYNICGSKCGGLNFNVGKLM